MNIEYFFQLFDRCPLCDNIFDKDKEYKCCTNNHFDFYYSRVSASSKFYINGVIIVISKIYDLTSKYQLTYYFANHILDTSNWEYQKELPLQIIDNSHNVHELLDKITKLLIFQ